MLHYRCPDFFTVVLLYFSVPACTIVVSRVIFDSCHALVWFHLRFVMQCSSFSLCVFSWLLEHRSVPARLLSKPMLFAVLH